MEQPELDRKSTNGKGTEELEDGRIDEFEDGAQGELNFKCQDENEESGTRKEDSEEALARAWLNIVDVSSGEEDEEEEHLTESSWFKSEDPDPIAKYEPEDEDEDLSSDWTGNGGQENNDGEIYECPIPGCGEVFSSDYDLDLHSIEHDNESTQFTCEECGEDFASGPELVEHERLHSEISENSDQFHKEAPKRRAQEDGKEHKCPSCDRTFDRFFKLKNHMLNCMECGEAEGSMSGMQRDCQKCGELVTVSLMLKHLKEHALDEIESWAPEKEEHIVCKYCERVFDSKYKTLNHLLSHYLPDRTFECSVCCYPSSSQSLSKWHTRHVCSQERKDFMKAANIQGVKRKRPANKASKGKETVRCDLCNKVLKKGSLANHKAIVHKEVVEVFKCRLCDKVYYSKPNLKFHVDTVHRMKYPVYPCGTCRKLFHSAEERTEHSRTAHVPKKIRCSVCDVELVYYSAKCHYLRHAWEMLGMEEATSDTFGFFPCSMCDRTFSYAQHVVNHIVNHFQPQRIFECDKCFLALSTQSLLAKHKVACNGFAAESDMKRNWKKIGVRAAPARKQSEETYSVQLHKWQCEKCEKLFDTEEECEHHIRDSHDTEEDTVEAGGNIFFVYTPE